MEYQKYIEELKSKGLEEGITRQDYQKLLKYNKQLWVEYNRSDISKESLKEIGQVIDEIEELIYIIKECGFKEQINSQNIDYIMSHSIISGIAFANCERKTAKPYSIDSYMYLCNFHREKTPSLGVSDNKNLFYCFGCGTGGNIFEYLMKYENLHFIDRVYLLSAINGIKIPNNKYNDNSEKVIKYRAALTSKEYLNILKRALDRNIIRNITTINNSLTCKNQTIEEYFDEKFETIERIRKGITDNNFIFVPNPEKIFLLPEEETIDHPVKKLIKPISDYYNEKNDLPF